MEITHESEDNNNEEILNALFGGKNGEVVDLNISVIDKGTPIHQGLESDVLPREISRQENLESTAVKLE